MDFEEFMHEVESAVKDTPPATQSHQRHTILSHVDKPTAAASTYASGYAKTAPLPTKQPPTASKSNARSDLDELLDLVDGPGTSSGRSTTTSTYSSAKDSRSQPAYTASTVKQQPPSSSAYRAASTGAPSSSAKRCTAVFLGGAQMKHGVSTSCVNPQACSNLRCNDCDFAVVQFEHTKWSESADYMFFRENVPNEAKLRRKMEACTGAFAYACQCKWASVTTKATPDSLQIKWCCAGH